MYPCFYKKSQEMHRNHSRVYGNSKHPAEGGNGWEIFSYIFSSHYNLKMKFNVLVLERMVLYHVY